MSITGIDWSKGCAFIQDGTIYCSPNCSRPVLIPPKASSSGPFDAPPPPRVQPDQSTITPAAFNPGHASPPNAHHAYAATNPALKDSLKLEIFRQPVWWTDSFGWLAFVPLTPSFTAKPFEAFCWMPRIHKKEMWRRNRTNADPKEYSYGMAFDDQKTWKDAEDLLVEAAERLRLWHRLPGRMPPRPSSFGYLRHHKSQGMAQKMIMQSRDWFVVWMGYLSYLVAQAKCPENWHDMKPDPNVPVPAWYTKLATDLNYRESWLDGLTSSTVCTFNSRTPRAGIIYEWVESDKTRPPIQFFLDLNIPVYYPWRCVEENALRTYIGNVNRQDLQPPQQLVQEALDKVFANSSFPLGGLVIRSYYKHKESADELTLKVLQIHYASSFVFRYVCRKFEWEPNDLQKYHDDPVATHKDLEQIIKEQDQEQERKARMAASLPTQTMIELDDGDVKGKLYDDWNSYFQKRLKRRAELLRVEDTSSRDVRMQRERQKPLKNTTMYAWSIIRSSGGVPLYMRVRIKKSEHESKYHGYNKANRVYDGFTNEWDLCHGFTPPHELSEAANDDHQMDYGDGDLSEDDNDDLYFRFEESAGRQETYSGSEVDRSDGDYSAHELVREGYTRPKPVPESYTLRRSLEVKPELQPTFEHSQQRDEDRGRYKEELGNLENIRMSELQDMIQTLKFSYGYVPSLACGAREIPGNWISVAQTFGFARHGAQERVGPADQEAIGRFFNAFMGAVTQDLPVDLWDLNDNSHVALAHMQDFNLIHRPYRNLFVFSQPRQEDSDWMLGVESPELALYVCRLVHSKSDHTVVSVAYHLLLHGMPFRTLKGMFLRSRVTTVSKEYIPTSFRKAGYRFTPGDYDTYMLQCQDLLTMSQGRGVLLKGGIIARIAREFLSMNDCLRGPSYEMTQHQLGFVISSGSLFHYCDDELTENELAMICGTYTIYTGLRDQVTVKSWFPPANLWDHTATRNGVKWVEWSERNEQFYMERVAEIQAGTGQPMSRAQWKAKLRGNSTTRNLLDIAERRAQQFVDTYIPIKAPEIDRPAV